MATIFYTKTDEAPALATASLLPIVKAFTKTAGIALDLKDISLAARIIAAFSDAIDPALRLPNDLSFLGQLAKTPEAHIIKLPNISASIPQLKEAIAELQEKGYPLPPYPDAPTTKAEKNIKIRYDHVKGSAVNPVLREGNSDRRAPKAVKNYAKKHPHPMGPWSPHSKTHVATMTHGDFRHTEKSLTLQQPHIVRIEHISEDGTTTVFKADIALQKGEIIDAAVMQKTTLETFLHKEIAEAREKNLLLSLHLKATMMKVSDPLIFGHALQAYFTKVFATHAETLNKLGVHPSEGLESLLAKIATLPQDQHQQIQQAITQSIENGPDLAMVNSEKGITNLHVPSDVIIDASMPAMIRNSGKMWNKDGKPQDTKAIIPDSSYAGVYQATIDFCKEHGAFDPATMGTVPNVGLMAQKAEEYGSHDKTFRISQTGTVRVVSTTTGQTLLEHSVAPGDIWRMCQVKDAPIQDWIALAVNRATTTGMPAVFWLDTDRPHDAELIKKVNAALQHNTKDLAIHILPPTQATQFTLKRLKAGKDTLSVTGNVLRDYLTDLFPILELGTSAKMLSIVPLMHGGGLFETGAGGSAPKHVAQFVTEGHLRWDSLGEFLALGAALEHYGTKNHNPKALVLAKTLDQAIETFLDNNKSPSRKVNALDTRGSHFYLALYWAQALAQQKEDPTLQATFAPLYKALSSDETKITQELLAAQGAPVNLGGYYAPKADLVAKAMRPSKTFNNILATIPEAIA